MSLLDLTPDQDMLQRKICRNACLHCHAFKCVGLAFCFRCGDRLPADVREQVNTLDLLIDPHFDRVIERALQCLRLTNQPLLGGQ